MARFKLFPHSRRLSLGELLGISQAERQVSRKHRLRIVRDTMRPLKNTDRRAKQRAGYRPPTMLARFLRRLLRWVSAASLMASRRRPDAPPLAAATTQVPRAP